MKFDELTKELQQWIVSAVREGHPRDTILQSLKDYGHAEGTTEAVDEYIEKLKAQGHVIRPSSTSVLASIPATQTTSDRDVQILMALNNPRVILFGDLLSHEECDELIELSKARLTPSTVVNPTTGTYDQEAVRTSYGAFFKRGENKLIQRIETRLSELIGCPINHGEPIQILNYAPGAEYKPHVDYFDPKQPGNTKILAMGGQRYATIIMYLNDVAAGGSTVFPHLGLDILPRKGNALFFSYANEHGDLDVNSTHGGSPVHEGEKWIATKWLRIGNYTGP